MALLRNIGPREEARFMANETGADTLKKTALHDLHVDLHTREAAGLFDVGHMGQVFIVADDGTFETAAKALEALVPASIADLEPGQQRYTQLTDDNGGILDDLMVSRINLPGHDHMLYLVVKRSEC